MLLGLRHWQLCSGYIHECKHCHMLRSTSIVCSCLNEGESLVKVPIHVHTFHPIVTSMSLVSGLLSSQWLYWLCYTESNFVFCIANYGINTEMSWLPVYVPLDPKHLFSHWINKNGKACGIYIGHSWDVYDDSLIPRPLEGDLRMRLVQWETPFLNPSGHPVLCCSCLWCLLLLMINV